VILERDGEGKSHLPGGSSSGFKRVQADSASISVFLEYARALTKDKKFKEALSVISLCAQVGDKLIFADNPQTFNFQENFNFTLFFR